jgi:hypothetical protein
MALQRQIKLEEFRFQGCGSVSEERRFTQELHGATSHKTAFFIVTAVLTSNITKTKLVYGSWHHVDMGCNAEVLKIFNLFVSKILEDGGSKIIQNVSNTESMYKKP